MRRKKKSKEQTEKELIEKELAIRDSLRKKIEQHKYERIEADYDLIMYG